MRRLWMALFVTAGAGMASVALAVGPGVASVSAACPHAGAHAHEISLPELRKTMTCLVNRERAKRGRGRLKANKRLTTAAQGHNDVMLAERVLPTQLSRRARPRASGQEERLPEGTAGVALRREPGL